MAGERQQFEYHPRIGYRFIPGLKARIRSESGGYLVRVNQAGFRCDREFVRSKTPGTRRALLFGDSFTAGDGVSNGKRYGNLLEELVPSIEVFNFGLPGTGTDQHYLAYQEFGAKLEHDLLIIAVLVENVRRIAAHYRLYQDERGRHLCLAKPYFTVENGRLVLHQVPVPRDPLPEEALSAEEGKRVDRGGRFPRLRGIASRYGGKDFLQAVTRYQPVPEYGDPKNQAWQVMRAILSEWVQGHAGPALLVPLPLYQHVEGTSDPAPYQRRFRELAAETGCALHDPLPDLMEYPLAERRAFRFERDVHPTPAGHRALAQSMVPVVTRILERK